MLMKVVMIVDKDSKLYIKDIARITGLSEQLIRKWEDRYHVAVSYTHLTLPTITAV